MAQIAILANSKRPDGQCLAGIDLATGAWVRPVTKTGDGIPTNQCFVDGKFVVLRDILELDLVQPRTIPQYQRENQTIQNLRWQVTRRLKLDAVRDYIENAVPILHSTNDRVLPTILDALQPRDWKSLQLVKPVGLAFGRHYYDPNRWVANFADRAGNQYSLKVTDPIVTRRLESGEIISNNSVLTVSLTKPWTPNAAEKPPLCYKVIAAVIELT